MRRLWILLALLVPMLPCHAEPGTGAESAPAAAAPAEAPPARSDSILVFAGRLSTTDFTSTLLFNLLYTPKLDKPSYDNDIVGLEYEHDLLEIAHDVRLRVEGGLAERYGHYLVCCLTPAVGPHVDTTVRIDGRVYSTEMWGGGKIRWENFRPAAGVRVEVAATVGLSFVTRTIGRERQREIEREGNAHTLGYVAPEIGVALDRLPNFELVVRVPHRSGAWGTFCHMQEGYNADVVGVRYAF